MQFKSHNHLLPLLLIYMYVIITQNWICKQIAEHFLTTLMLVLKQFHTDVALEQCSNFVPCQPLQPRPVDHNQSDDSLKHKQNIKYQKHPTDDNQSDDTLKHKRGITAPNIQQTIIASAQLEVPK